MPIERISLLQQIRSRDGTFYKDSRVVNGYKETLKQKERIVKRPGYSVLTTLPASGGLSVGQGMYNFVGDTIAVVENQVFKIHWNGIYELIGTLNEAVAVCYFTQSGSFAVPEVIVTSTLYPLENKDGLSVTSSSATPAYSPLTIEGFSVTQSAISSGSLVIGVLSYNNYAPEGLSVSASSIPSGSLVNNVITYTYYAPEGLSVSASSIPSGSLVNDVITYTYYAPEGYSVTSSTISSGSLI
jgi:hypothetical protein